MATLATVSFEDDEKVYSVDKILPGTTESTEKVICKTTDEDRDETKTTRSDDLSFSASSDEMSDDMLKGSDDGDDDDEGSQKEEHKLEYLRKRAILILFSAAIADAANSQVLGPNYAIMVTPGGNPESFPTTDPFGFAAANYFIPMSAQLAVATANLIIPNLSDRYGRRNILLCNLAGSLIFTLLKYFLRGNFWYFCLANVANGIASTTPAVGLGYISDLYQEDRKKADGLMGLGIAFNVVGRTLGFFLAIAMSRTLFLPLLPVAGVSGIMFLIVYFLMEEPSAIRQKMGLDAEKFAEIEDGDSDGGAAVDAPKELHKPTLWNVLLGAFADNIGSAALVPMCLSTVMFQTYLSDFFLAGETPIMSEQAYRWIYSLLALSVIPGAVVSPVLFERFGPALCCVVGNLATAAFICCLMFLALGVATVTKTNFLIFVAVLYLGFPITFISNLTTGPMLDRIAPMDQRGHIQGLNMAVIDFTSALVPFLLGLQADNWGVRMALWTGIGVSIGAALINTPLIFNSRLKPREEELLADEEEGECQSAPSDHVRRTLLLVAQAKGGSSCMSLSSCDSLDILDV